MRRAFQTITRIRLSSKSSATFVVSATVVGGSITAITSCYDAGDQQLQTSSFSNQLSSSSSSSPSFGLLGLRREARFWSTIGPAAFDYYWNLSSSSPYVKYRKWWRKSVKKNDDDDRGMIMTKAKQLFAVDDGGNSYRDGDTSATSGDGTNNERGESTLSLSLSSSLEQEQREIEEREKEERTLLLESLHAKHAPRIFEIMVELGGLYVKLGQVLSVTALPVPKIYRNLFRTLQGDVPSRCSFDDVIVPLLRSEWNVSNLEDIFESIDPVPCGAASIGQAHRARLICGSGRGGGISSSEEVVIKVQYPDASWQVPADIQCISDLANLCVRFGVVDEMAVSLSMDEFSRQFLSELDYVNELYNLRTIYESSLDPKAPYQKLKVVIPKPIPHLCTGKVVTMEYLPGPKFEEEARRRLEEMGIDTSGGIREIVQSAAGGDTTTDIAVDNINEEGAGADNTIPNTEQRTFTQRFVAKVGKVTVNLLGVDLALRTYRSVRSLSLSSPLSKAKSMSKTVVLRFMPRSVAPSVWIQWVEEEEVRRRHSNKVAGGRERMEKLSSTWVDALFDVHGHQVFSLGLFNADPHPGNIILLGDDYRRNTDDRTTGDDSESNGKDNDKGNVHKANGELGLIDFGQCKRLPLHSRVLVARLILSIADHKPDEEVANAFRSLGATTKKDSTKYLADLARLMFGSFRPEHLDHEWHEKLHKMDGLVIFPTDLSLVYRTSLLLRGLGMSLGQNCSVAELWKEHALGVVERHGGDNGVVNDIVVT